ncbi:Phosphatidylinositol 4-kinase LSB6 [Entomophthora muscae]|uniref:Phosphatidylinositol 4-kinase LSB6 n=1 Tax=Entomophthora muscae TaxID=34485 RepID=A0ACC2SGG3_9FUNG|nr:Phosphatidylinositol 4-kinase LSB6 [Entomophthora muscae]
MSAHTQPPTPEPTSMPENVDCELKIYIQSNEETDCSKQSQDYQSSLDNQAPSVQAAFPFSYPNSSSCSLAQETLSQIMNENQSVDLPINLLSDVSPQQFIAIISEVRQSIADGRRPIRIHQGSSGSYFCLGQDSQKLGVFKPKNEEPYGHLNPKWAKWIHRNLFPCCFGRSSLIPNVGYLSEAGASLIDRQLNLGLVPRTEVVKLASSSFYYSWRCKSDSLPLKVGSFQLFLDGYENASSFLARHPWPTAEILSLSPSSENITLPMLAHDQHSQQSLWTPLRQQQFRLQLERLVAFDYLIRNTDRGIDNWMIKLNGQGISIAAIDHGLAFPHKHPNNWRSYPYGWLQLPSGLIDRPFSKSTREFLLPLLTSTHWWQETEYLLLKLNQLDPDFNSKMFNRQIEVMRGQGWNLVECLKQPDSGPLELSQLPSVVVLEHEVCESNSPVEESTPSHSYTPSLSDSNWPDPFLNHAVLHDTSTRKRVTRKLKILTSKAWFSSC